MATSKKKPVTKGSAEGGRAPASLARHVVDYGRYKDVDWVAFADLLRQRLSISDDNPTKAATELGWPVFVLRSLLRGRPVRDSRVDRLLTYLGMTGSEVPRLTAARVRRQGNRIFISYSHKDQDYLERLMVHLRPLEKKGMIDAWVDTRLKIGDRWRKEVGDALRQASVGILLVSADFLASGFIIEDELPPLRRGERYTDTPRDRKAVPLRERTVFE